MPEPVPDLIRRQRALEKTKAKYSAEAFAWSGANCAKLLRSHLVAMDHKRLPKMPDFTSALGAKRALLEMGHDSVAALLDSLLPRIPVSRALLGDVILMGSGEEHGLDAVTLAAGGGKVMGWHEDAPGLVVIDPVEIIGAWRA